MFGIVLSGLLLIAAIITFIWGRKRTPKNLRTYYNIPLIILVALIFIFFVFEILVYF